MSSSIRTLVLVGKLGHGKTSIINKICGTNYLSQMGARSCTTCLQFGTTRKYGMRIVDTPGFYSSERITSHIAKQKFALESTTLSGVYIVVKFGRADEMAETVNKAMDFVGDDDVRIIITHADIVGEEAAGYQIGETKQRLSELLDVKECNITAVGRYTDGTEIEDFFHSTLHSPKKFEVSKEQLAYVSTLCVGARQFNSVIEQVSAKLHASTMACQELSSSPKCREMDIAIRAIMKETVSMVEKAKASIFEKAQELAPEQQNIIRAKIQESLDLQKEIFVEATTSCLVVHWPKRRAHTPWFRKHHHHQGPAAIHVDFYGDDTSGWKIQYRVNDHIVPLHELRHNLKNNIKVATHEAQDNISKQQKRKRTAVVVGSSFPQRKHQRLMNHHLPPNTAPSSHNASFKTAAPPRSEPPLFLNRYLSSEGNNESSANILARRRAIPLPYLSHPTTEQDGNNSASKTTTDVLLLTSKNSPPTHHQPPGAPRKSTSSKKTTKVVSPLASNSLPPNHHQPSRSKSVKALDGISSASKTTANVVIVLPLTSSPPPNHHHHPSHPPRKSSQEHDGNSSSASKTTRTDVLALTKLRKSLNGINSSASKTTTDALALTKLRKSLKEQDGNSSVSKTTTDAPPLIISSSAPANLCQPAFRPRRKSPYLSHHFKEKDGDSSATSSKRTPDVIMPLSSGPPPNHRQPVSRPRRKSRSSCGCCMALMFAFCGVITPLLNCQRRINRHASTCTSTHQEHRQQLQQGVELSSHQSATSERTV